VSGPPSSGERTVLVATRNAGKLRELVPLFASLGVRVASLHDVGLPEEGDEDALEAFDTFEANALAKARHFHARSGMSTVADDSGLVVDALGGAPGVYSKRYGGRRDLSGPALDAANNAKLLSALLGSAERRARFVCAAAYVDVDGELVQRGETAGVILEAATGSGGFGYDPLFWSEELALSFGDATRDAKAAISHRGRAFRALVAALAARGSAGSAVRDRGG
jgi:XTP/dITP diphosphohydrolase